MRLTQLSLTNFRNYHRLELSPPAGVSLIFGANAQGKTNLLEAMYLLATTRAARGSAEAELIRRGAGAEGLPAARVAGRAQTAHGQVTVEVAVAQRAETVADGAVERTSKRLKVNGIAKRASDVIGQITAVLFTATDIDLITGPPAIRRRYLDITISQTDGAYVRSLQRYARVLLQRNALLRRIADGQARPDELTFWDEELLREGAQVTHARARTVQALSLAARDYHARLSQGEVLEVWYAPQTALPPGDLPAVALVQESLGAALAGQRRREIAAGATLIGPHRDDLRFDLGGVAVAAYGSRAQQRSAALALRMAEMAFLTGANRESPLLLLDDIFSELDEERRRAVLTLLGDAEQVFVTSAEPDRFDAQFRSRAAIYQVQAGTLTAQAAEDNAHA